MDTYRAFIAVVFSFIILMGYQYFFVTPQQVATTEPAPSATEQPQSAQTDVATPATVIEAPAALLPTAQAPVLTGRDLRIETDLYSAVITENGGGFKSFKLKEYNETLTPDSDFKELVTTENFKELPFFFSWGVEPASAMVPVFSADRQAVKLTGKETEGSLVMTGAAGQAVEITRSLTIDNDSYLIKMSFDIHNISGQALQGAPFLSLTNLPFSGDKNRNFLFSGPALLVNGELQEIKTKDIEAGGKKIQGSIGWAAYEGTYFMCGVIPEQHDGLIVQLFAGADEKVTTLLTGAADLIPADGRRQYNYTIYFGPKKITVLKEAGANLEQIVNFGWFDVLAKPALTLLNFFYRYVHNYGIAIILVTVLIKLLLWPVAQKGMKSMKNMQLIQPKIAKIREKHKNDTALLNQEMMNLYKTYKVNPLGGCLPMFLQIPVFFALYKVLLQAIELRHAPFMLWITDLSAPDRLWPGLGLPYLEGIPILTLLMGGSMFLQQKMTPSPADPTQAKIMMFLPVVFTFMFLNFASGLVLYWFVNNLLSIGQQYMVNRPEET